MQNQLTAEEIMGLLGLIDRVDIKGAEAESVIVLKQKLRAIGEETIEKQKVTKNVVDKMSADTPKVPKSGK